MAYPQYAGNGGVAAAQDDYVDIPFPSTVNQYDILIATVLDADDDTFITPTGWNLVAQVNGSTASTIAVFWRRADGTETGTQRFYSNSAAGLVMGGIMARFTGCVRTGTPYGASANAGITFSDTVTLPSINPAGNERLVCAFIGVEDDKTLAQASNYTQQYHVLDTTGSDFALGLQTQQVPYPQTIGAETALLEGSVAESWGTISISLIPPTKHALQGGINVYSNVSGDLVRIAQLEGTVGASSSVSGNLKVIRKLAGQIAATATITGAITMQAALTGAIQAQSSVSGNLAQTHRLQGSINAQSTVYGDLFRIGPTWSLEGHINETSDVYADSMYPIPQWELVEEFTGRSLGDVMGYDSDQQFLAAAWTPTKDVKLAGIQVWLSQEDKLPPDTPISGAVWRDGGIGQGPEPWGEIDYSALTERRADRIVAGTSNTGGALYTFEFGLYDPDKPSFKAGEKYWIVLYPSFGGTTPEKTIWWQGNGVFNSRNERWYGNDVGEAWTHLWGGTRYLRLFAAPNQVHSLEGHIADVSTVEGDLYVPRTYYVRADGTASKDNATDPNSASTSMSPATFAASTFLPKETVVWSAKGGDYEQVSVSNASSGDSKYPIYMRGEFGGAGRPWISGGIRVTGTWTKVTGEDRWWIPLVASPKTRNVVADGVDLGWETGTPSEVDQPGEWAHNQFEDRLYMGGATSPDAQFSEIWVQKADGPIIEITGNYWVIEDLYLTLGYRSDGYSGTTAGLEITNQNNITVRRVGGVGHYGTGIRLSGISNLAADEIEFSGSYFGIDISDSTRSNGFLLQRSEFVKSIETAVKIENGSYQFGQKIRRVLTDAYTRNFSLQNMSGGLIEQCRMRNTFDDGGDAVLGGVNVIGGIVATTVRNCLIDGGNQNAILAGLVVMEATDNVEIAFVHNEVLNTNYGAAYVFDFTDSWLMEITTHNNTVVNTVGGFYAFAGAMSRISVRNNIFFNYVTSPLDDPVGGFIADGTAEQPTMWLSFANNHYRDPRKPLTWFYKTGPVNFGGFAAAVGEANSYEQNPVLNDPASGEYWLGTGSPAAGTGDGSVYNELWTIGIVPGSMWPNIDTADQRDYEAPSWNRGAYLPAGATPDGLALEGHVFVVSNVSGDLQLVKLPLEGHIGATSSISGDLTVLQSGAALPLKGSIAAKSSLSGDLFAPTKWSLEGHIAAKSYFNGDLYAPNRHQLAGAISEQSSLTGDLSQNYLQALEGAIEATSDVAGDLMAIRGLEGHIAAQSQVSGELTMLEALWDLEGHIAAQSDVQGDLHIHTPVEGHIEAQSSVSGALTARKKIEGSIDAQSAVSGALSLRQALQGSVAAQSSLSGDLRVYRKVEGHVAAQSTVYGDLTQIEAKWQLEGHVAAQSALNGDLLVKQTMTIADGGAQHAHRAQGAKELNYSVADLNGSASYPILPGGQLLHFSFDAVLGYQTYVFVARDVIPISTQYLRIRQNSTRDLIIDQVVDGVPTTLYTDTLFFTWGNPYDFKVILYEDGTMSVWVNENLEWSGSVDPEILTYGYGGASASTVNGFDLWSWNWPTIDLLQHHFVSIDSATHGHTADSADPVENIDLTIDDAAHAHVADEPVVAVTHHLEIDDALHLTFAEELDLVEGIDLVVEDSLHGHAADNLDLTQQHVLAVNDAAHYNIAEHLALGGTGYLGVNAGSHSHSAENVDLTQAHTLAVDDAAHGHSADEATLAVTSYLAVDDSQHGHSADEIDLDQAHVLAIDDALHSHAADEVTLAVTSYLAINDAAHGHQSENLDLVENIDLLIDDALHQHSADSADLAVMHMLFIEDASHPHASENLDLIQGITLEVDDASHAHSVDGLTLAEKSLLEIQDAFHIQLADEPTLSAGIDLEIDDAAHGHVADAVALQHNHILEIDDAIHAHLVENVPISTVGILGIFSARHAHQADAVTLDQVHSIAVADCDHQHSADELALVQNIDLVIDSASHGHEADPADIAQTHILSIDDCQHGHNADPCNLTPTPVLVIQKGRHMHYVDVVSLTQHHSLAVNDTAHAVSSDEISISQQHTLAIDDCSHGHLADACEIVHYHLLQIQDASHEHAAEGLPVFPQNSVLQIADGAHGHTGDEIPIVVGFYLEVDDAAHGHAADEVGLSQLHDLSIDEAFHQVLADDTVLDTPWYQTQRASALVGEDPITATLEEDCIDVRIYSSEEDCT